MGDSMVIEPISQNKNFEIEFLIDVGFLVIKPYYQGQKTVLKNIYPIMNGRFSKLSVILCALTAFF